MNNQQELLTKSVLDTWRANITRTDALIDSLTDEQLEQEIAPGKNRGIYVLGHLAAVHDRMMPLLGFGEQQFAHLDGPFLTSPDKAVAELPATADIRTYWKEANKALDHHISGQQPGDWFQKHTSVSDEDFAKESHRNKLSVLVSRTNHAAYHYGQLMLLKK